MAPATLCRIPFRREPVAGCVALAWDCRRRADVIVVITRDLQLAQRLGDVIDGRKGYIVTPQSQKELRHRLHQVQPEVIVLDVTFGGNDYRVLDEVLAFNAIRSGPAVIALLPWTSATAKRQASCVGCFEVLVTSRRLFERKVALAVRDALQARAAGALADIPKRHEKGSLH